MIINILLPLLLSWYITRNEVIQNIFMKLYERGLPDFLYKLFTCIVCLTTTSSIIYFLTFLNIKESIVYGILMGILAKLLNKFNI